LHLHLHFLQSAKNFAKNEVQEIGFYLNWVCLAIG
jgi:hypothetical protein